MIERVNNTPTGAVPVIDKQAQAESRARMAEQRERDGIDDKLAAIADLIGQDAAVAHGGALPEH